MDSPSEPTSDQIADWTDKNVLLESEPPYGVGDSSSGKKPTSSPASIDATFQAFEESELKILELQEKWSQSTSKVAELEDVNAKLTARLKSETHDPPPGVGAVSNSQGSATALHQDEHPKGGRRSPSRHSKLKSDLLSDSSSDSDSAAEFAKQAAHASRRRAYALDAAIRQSTNRRRLCDAISTLAQMPNVQVCKKDMRSDELNQICPPPRHCEWARIEVTYLDTQYSLNRDFLDDVPPPSLGVGSIFRWLSSKARCPRRSSRPVASDSLFQPTWFTSGEDREDSHWRMYYRSMENKIKCLQEVHNHCLTVLGDFYGDDSDHRKKLIKLNLLHELMDDGHFALERYAEQMRKDQRQRGPMSPAVASSSLLDAVKHAEKAALHPIPEKSDPPSGVDASSEVDPQPKAAGDDCEPPPSPKPTWVELPSSDSKTPGIWIGDKIYASSDKTTKPAPDFPPLDDLQAYRDLDPAEQRTVSNMLLIKSKRCADCGTKWVSKKKPGCTCHSVLSCPYCGRGSAPENGDFDDWEVDWVPNCKCHPMLEPSSEED
jgi:hypothetical protein